MDLAEYTLKKKFYHQIRYIKQTTLGEENHDLYYSYYGENGYSISLPESRFFFFFKPFILYWNIADYNAIVVSGGFSRGSVVKNLPAYSHVWM